MDISQVLLALAFVGLIFILLDSYCGCNTLEGIEETKAYCNQKEKRSKCPGIDGMLCTELTGCLDKEKCPCPTREEILKNICPPPSCPPPASFDQFLIKDGEDYGTGYLFKKIFKDNYIDRGCSRHLVTPLWRGSEAWTSLINNPLDKFELNKFFIILDPPIEFLITPKEDTNKTYTFTYKLLSKTWSYNFILTLDTELSPAELDDITNANFLELYRKVNETNRPMYEYSSGEGTATHSRFVMKTPDGFSVDIDSSDGKNFGPVYDNSKVEINSLEVKLIH